VEALAPWYATVMRIIAIAAVLAAPAFLSLPGRAHAAQGCTTAAAHDAATAQLLPYADRHAPRFFGQYGGAAKLGYQRGTLLCRDMTGDGDREMIVRLLCRTGGSPSPWAIFRHDANGAWRLAYARAVDTVFRLGVSGRAVRAMMPAPYEGACTRFVRFRVVRWSGTRFRSQIAARRRISNGC
jgi:hypothetical protein